MSFLFSLLVNYKNFGVKKTVFVFIFEFNKKFKKNLKKGLHYIKQTGILRKRSGLIKEPKCTWF